MRAILTFHSVDASGAVLAYPPALFALLLKTLDDKGIPILTLDAVLEPGITRGVALTFDDGMRSVLTDALPVLREHNAVSHIYITSDLMGSKVLWPPDAGVGQFRMLSWSEVDQLLAAGQLMEGHTKTHPDVRTLSIARLEEECGEADDEIERHTGRRPQHFAYPFGFHNRQARKFAAKHYATAVSAELATLANGFDLAAVPRIDSYYLQSPWRIRHIDSLWMNGYLQARSALRTIKGSQCRPDVA